MASLRPINYVLLVDGWGVKVYMMDEDIVERFAQIMHKHLSGYMMPMHCFRPNAKEGDFQGQINIEMHNKRMAKERDLYRRKSRVLLNELMGVPQGRS